MLVSTDVCLRALEGRFRSMGLPLVINYDLPSRKARMHPQDNLVHLIAHVQPWFNMDCRSVCRGT